MNADDPFIAGISPVEYAARMLRNDVTPLPPGSAFTAASIRCNVPVFGYPCQLNAGHPGHHHSSRAETVQPRPPERESHLEARVTALEHRIAELEIDDDSVLHICCEHADDFRAALTSAEARLAEVLEERERELNAYRDDRDTILDELDRIRRERDDHIAIIRAALAAELDTRHP